MYRVYNCKHSKYVTFYLICIQNLIKNSLTDDLCSNAQFHLIFDNYSITHIYTPQPNQLHTPIQSIGLFIIATN